MMKSTRHGVVSDRSLFVIFIIVLFYAVTSCPALAQSYADQRREFFELDFRIKQWQQLQSKNSATVIPQGLQEDVVRRDELGLAFVYSYLMVAGRSLFFFRQYTTVRVPIPKGRKQEGKDVLDAFSADKR